MTTSQAWLLECGDSLSIAIGFHEMAELLQNHKTYTVPGSPGYCSSLLIWQDNMVVPIMDISSLYNVNEANHESPFTCLLMYQEAPQTPLQYLALQVRSAPRIIQIDDDQVCDLPQEIDESPLRPAVLSCFLHQEKPVLIIDIAHLCSADFRDLANAA